MPPPTPDQQFGEIASVLVKQQLLQNPAQFGAAVEKGLRQPRPRGRKLHISEMHRVRDWKTWTEPLNIQIGGLAGAGASHSTRLIRRRGDPSVGHNSETTARLDHCPPSFGLLVGRILPHLFAQM